MTLLPHQIRTARIRTLVTRREFHQTLMRIERPTLKSRAVRKMLDCYYVALGESRLAIDMLLPAHCRPTDDNSDKHDRALESARLLSISYLLDRITSTPVNILNIVQRDPLLGAPDVASMHRTSFESAVNFLYILGDPTRTRFKAFMRTSLIAEQKLFEGLAAWEAHDNPYFSVIAKSQRAQTEAPTSARNERILEMYQLDEAIPPYPNLRRRCETLGELWLFLYDSRYRGLSAWQHGDHTRAMVASVALQVPEFQERLLFESLNMVSWSWDLVFQFVLELASTPPVQTPEVPTFFNADAIYRELAHAAMDDAIIKYQRPDLLNLDEVGVGKAPDFASAEERRESPPEFSAYNQASDYPRARAKPPSDR